MKCFFTGEKPNLKICKELCNKPCKEMIEETKKRENQMRKTLKNKTEKDTMKMKIYTSEEILSMEDLYEIQEMASCGITIKYQLTDTEIEWLEFITGRYEIADYIHNNSDENFILSITSDYELSIYLDFDCKGFGKAVMLSDDTALQRIFFWLYREDIEDEE